MKNQEKKIQESNINQLKELNKTLKDLVFHTEEWDRDTAKSNKDINTNLALKLRNSLESLD
jgi:NRPS condensation-like uncharacterized protein